MPTYNYTAQGTLVTYDLMDFSGLFWPIAFVLFMVLIWKIVPRQKMEDEQVEPPEEVSMDEVEEVLDSERPIIVSEEAYKAYLKKKDMDDFKRELREGTNKR